MDFSALIGLAHSKQMVISVNIVIPEAGIKGKQMEDRENNLP